MSDAGLTTPDGPGPEPRPRRKPGHAPPERLTEPKGPWDRRDDESQAAYTAFLVYRNLEPSRRSLEAASNQTRNSPPKGKRRVVARLESWSSRYGWVARAAAWDEEQARIKAEAEAEQLKRDIAESADRRRQLRADSWADYQALAAAVREQLAAIEPGPMGAKAVRELALARDRLVILAKEAFHGLDTAPDGDVPDPDLSAEITAVLARAALRKIGKG